jgi:DNA processing protein
VTPFLVRRGALGYPPRLRDLHDPPERLYVRGPSAEILARPSVAIVGARSCSPYGAQVARSLARELATMGLAVVSGMARGVDAEAHRGALGAGGLTIAVLGCGIDRDYPSRHSDLARRIAERGAVISEYGPGIEPAPWRFPARNRIIAALGLATVVVEARERSGALITADFALELGREVFSVPGEITSGLSAGTNDLLRQGAAPLLGAVDVLDALGLARASPRPVEVGREAAILLEALGNGAQAVDDLVHMSGITAAAAAAALAELELLGLVAEAEGVYRCLSDRPVLAR